MENNELKQCRICLQESPTTANLIVPCLCRGTAKYVHRRCLDNWRSQDPESDNFIRCRECHFKYVIEVIPEDPKDEKWRHFCYIMAVTFEIIKMILVFIIIVVIMSFILFLADRKRICRRWIPLRCNWAPYIIMSIVIIMLAFGIIYGEFNLYVYGSDIITCILYYIVFGFFVSIFHGYTHLKSRMRYRRELIWMRQEVEVRRVKDFGENPIIPPEGHDDRPDHQENELPEGHAEVDVVILN